MSKVSNLINNRTLSGGLSYFDYELSVGREILVPWLRQHMLLEGLRVGDFGCHQGGILEALRQEGKVNSGHGFDLDAPSIAASPFKTDQNFRLQVLDLNSLKPGQQRFDLILLRDVLEHIPDYESILSKARECLNPGGRIFISFPPYYSPFGGHQQEASNWTRAIPFLHYLPRSTFFKLVKTHDTLYMSQSNSLADMQSVSETRLTLHHAENAFEKTKLKIHAAEYFLFRPEFRIRYGLPTFNTGPACKLPILREVITMGVYYLLGAE